MPQIPLIIAHRGASADRPENTLAAFHEAWRQDADGIEGDFHLTRDGVVVCHHDPIVDFQDGGGRRDIARSDFAALARAALPTLAEVLAIIPPGKAFFCEAKTGPEIVPALAATLASFPAVREGFHLISFSTACLEAARASRLPGKRSWLLPYAPAMAQEPLAAARATLEQVAALGCHAVGLEAHRGLAGGYLEELRRAGLPCHLWTVDDPADARFWRTGGVASLTTNRPAALRRALA